MKKSTLTILVAFVVAIPVVVVLSQIIYDKTTPESLTEETCKTREHQSYTVEIKNDTVSPAHVDAKLCDTITINNNDDKEREIAFGEHDHHTTYDGKEETTVEAGGSFSFTALQTGNFRFHDHDQDEVYGTFTVQ